MRPMEYVALRPRRACCERKLSFPIYRNEGLRKGVFQIVEGDIDVVLFELRTPLVVDMPAERLVWRMCCAIVIRLVKDE